MPNNLPKCAVIDFFNSLPSKCHRENTTISEFKGLIRRGQMHKWIASHKNQNWDKIPWDSLDPRMKHNMRELPNWLRQAVGCPTKAGRRPEANSWQPVTNIGEVPMTPGLGLPSLGSPSLGGVPLTPGWGSPLGPRPPAREATAGPATGPVVPSTSSATEGETAWGEADDNAAAETGGELGRRKPRKSAPY